MRSPLNGPGTARSAASAGDGLPTPLLAHTAPGAALHLFIATSLARVLRRAVQFEPQYGWMMPGAPA